MVSLFTLTNNWYLNSIALITTGQRVNLMDACVCKNTHRKVI